MPEEKTLTPQEELEILRRNLEELRDLSDRFDDWCWQPPEGYSDRMVRETMNAFRIIYLAMEQEAADLRLRIAVLEGVTG